MERNLVVPHDRKPERFLERTVNTHGAAESLQRPSFPVAIFGDIALSARIVLAAHCRSYFHVVWLSDAFK